MFIPRISSSSCQGNNTNMTFKIPLNSIYNSILFVNEHNSLEQEIQILDKSLILNDIDVILYDRFGNNLNNKNDYSFTLSVKYE